jgi:hypothetical protein
LWLHWNVCLYWHQAVLRRTVSIGTIDFYNYQGGSWQ